MLKALAIPLCINTVYQVRGILRKQWITPISLYESFWHHHILCWKPEFKRRCSIFVFWHLNLCKCKVIFTRLLNFKTNRNFIPKLLFFPHPDSIKIDGQMSVRYYLWLTQLFNTLRSTEWQPFSRRDYQIHFLEWKCIFFDKDFTEVCSQGSNEQ